MAASASADCVVAPSAAGSICSAAASCGTACSVGLASGAGFGVGAAVGLIAAVATGFGFTVGFWSGSGTGCTECVAGWLTAAGATASVASGAVMTIMLDTSSPDSRAVSAGLAETLTKP